MQRIYKYPLRATKTQFVALPRYAKIISFNVQQYTLCIWAVVDTDEPTVDSTEIKIIGTGNETGDLTGWKFLGTVLMQSDTLVLHAWAKTEEQENV